MNRKERRKLFYALKKKSKNLDFYTTRWTPENFCSSVSVVCFCCFKVWTRQSDICVMEGSCMIFRCRWRRGWHLWKLENVAFHSLTEFSLPVSFFHEPRELQRSNMLDFRQNSLLFSSAKFRQALGPTFGSYLKPPGPYCTLNAP